MSTKSRARASGESPAVATERPASERTAPLRSSRTTRTFGPKVAVKIRPRAGRGRRQRATCQHDRAERSHPRTQPHRTSSRSGGTLTEGPGQSKDNLQRGAATVLGYPRAMVRMSIVASLVAWVGCGDGAPGASDSDAADEDGSGDVGDAEDSAIAPDTKATRPASRRLTRATARPTPPPSARGCRGTTASSAAAWRSRRSTRANPGSCSRRSGDTLTRSDDDGLTFGDWSAGLSARRLAFPRDDTKHLFAATTLGLFDSDDAGVTFAPKALGGLDVHALLLHPASPQRLFAGTDGAGMMRSDDGGTSFAACTLACRV